MLSLNFRSKIEALLCNLRLLSGGQNGILTEILSAFFSLLEHEKYMYYIVTF